MSGDTRISGTLLTGTAKINGSANRPGLLEITKGGSESWSGISVEHTSTSAWSIMGDQDDFGFYDDYNNKWALMYNENSSLDLYHNGSKKFNTTSTGVNVSGTVTATGGNSTNWNSAYSWDNHATQGYLTSESDDQVIDDLSISGTVLGISLENDGQSLKTVDLSQFMDNTDTQLTEAQVVAFVANNGYTTSGSNPSFASITTNLTTFTNKERANGGTTNGAIYFDENYANDYSAFTGGDGGGLSILDQDGWGAIIATNNMKWITAEFDGLGIGVANPSAGFKVEVDGAIKVTGGNSTEWNTAYDQRGSTIAGTGLTWSSGKLNATNTNTDDQVIDDFSISGNTLSLSLEDDGESSKTVDLSAFDHSAAGYYQQSDDAWFNDLRLYNTEIISNNTTGLVELNQVTSGFPGNGTTGFLINPSGGNRWSIVGNNNFELRDETNDNTILRYNGGLSLFHNGSQRLRTNPDNVVIYGEIVSASQTDGSGLGRSSEWNAAYEWGDHAIEGYLKVDDQLGTNLKWHNGKLALEYAPNFYRIEFDHRFQIQNDVSVLDNVVVRKFTIEDRRNNYDMFSYYHELDNFTIGNNAIHINSDGISTDRVITTRSSDGSITGSSDEWNKASSISIFGTDNLFLGTGLASSISSLAESNVGVGNNSMNSLTSGDENIAFGVSALDNTTIGDRNVAIGHQALSANVSGEGNVAIGYQAGPESGNTTLNNSVAIGYQAKTTTSNQVRLGNYQIDDIGGTVSWSTVSDGRFKNNVKSDVSGLDFINRLNPVSYDLDTKKLAKFLGVEADENQKISDSKTTRQTGFVAQDVEKVLNETGYAFNGVHSPESDKDHYSIRYAEFVVPLTKAVQELNAMIETQNSIIADLQNQILTLQNSSEQNTESDDIIELPTNGIELLQNSPNPFTNDTKISMVLPNDLNVAKIIIYDLKGSELKTIPVNTRGNTSVVVNGNELGSGMYIYALIADGSIIDTKRMILTK